MSSLGRAASLIRTSSVVFQLLLLTLLIAFSSPAYATNNQDDAEEDEETSRVARVSFLRGDVTVERAGQNSWERATLNLPLVEGDTLATGRDARLEIQIDRHNFLRVNENSVLRIITLRDEGIALSLSEGTATLRLARFEREREYFELDAPQTTIAAERTGLYRLDVDRDGDVKLIVRDGGQARIYSETSGFTVRDGRVAELIGEGEEAGDWDIRAVASSEQDEWDRWTGERERFLAARRRVEERDVYYDRDIWGAEELDEYGNWAHTSEYGWVWQPHVTVINVYPDWSPYRYGRWRWCPPYGWTWVGDEPWGWAPYHYGRWVHHGGNWCWTPRTYGHSYGRNRWRPALVAFVTIVNNNNNHIAWYPLHYNQPDPPRRGRRRRGDQLEGLTPRHRNEIANLQRTNPAYLRAVTTLPAREFGRETARARPANMELARRAVTSEPLRDRLPVSSLEGDSSNNGDTVSRDGTMRRRTPSAPARSLPERTTGAMRRAPGVALDGELRRARIFENRQPRPVDVPTESRERDANDDRNERRSERRNERRTGAVVRPARPSEMRPPIERQPVERPPDASNDENRDSGNRNNGDENNRDADDAPSVTVRPVRPRAPRDDRRPVPPISDDGSDVERSRPARRIPRTPRNDSPREEQSEPRREEPPTAPPLREPIEPRSAPPREERPREERPREERPSAPPREERSAPREQPVERERPAERERPRDRPDAPARPARIEREIEDQ